MLINKIDIKATSNLFSFLNLITLLLLTSCKKDELEISTRTINFNTKYINDTICIDNNNYLIYNPYKNKGNFQLKGMLHCHTNNSYNVDKFGSGIPVENITKWKEEGNYDFFSITDHNYATEIIEIDGIINIGKGIEDTKKQQHLVILNLPNDYIYIDKGEDINILSKYYNNLGAYVVYAHPLWNGAYQSDDMIKRSNLCKFVEIYSNTVESARAFDIMLSEGNLVTAIGVDDYHYNKTIKNSYFNKAWTIVYAQKKVKESIWQALLSGASYASTGAEISNIKISKYGEIEVKCKKSSIIRFLGFNNQNIADPIELKINKNSTLANYQVKGNEEYIRIEIINEEGKASSQAFLIYKIIIK